MSDHANPIQSEWPDHYRYITTMDEDGVHIHCQRFIVVGETPYYYYVVREGIHGHLNHLVEAERQERTKKHRRRVSKHGLARYCYPDKRLALQSLSARQSHRIWHAKRNLSEATLAMVEADRMLAAGLIPGDGLHPCGHDEYTRSLNWGDC